MATRPCSAARTELIMHCCRKILPKVSLIQAAFVLSQAITPVSVLVSHRYVTFTCWNRRRHVPALSVALASGGPCCMS